MATTTSWAELGLGWASVERRTRPEQLAAALRRWRRLGPDLRAAVRALVLEQEQPSDEQAATLRAALMIGGEPPTCVPKYAGAAVVALEVEAARMDDRQAEAVLEWYRGDRGVVLDVYLAGSGELRGVPVGPLVRAGLVARDRGRVVRSTARGWAIAWLLHGVERLELAEVS